MNLALRRQIGLALIQMLRDQDAEVNQEIIEKLERQVAKIDSLLKEQGQLAAVNEQKKEGVVIGLKTLSLKSRLGGNHG